MVEDVYVAVVECCEKPWFCWVEVYGFDTL